MTERDEWHMLAAEWEIVAEDSTGYTKEHALLWRRYYLQKLGMIAINEESE